MFQPWRWKLRAAEEALRCGQLEEAQRITSDDALREFKPARALQAKIAQQLMERACVRAAEGQSEAGWRDLDAASRLGAESPAVARARRDMTQDAADELERLLAAGEYPAASLRLALLAQRGMRDESLRTLEEVATLLQAAQRRAQESRMAEAAEKCAAAERLRPDLPWIGALRRGFEQKQTQIAALAPRLHSALAAGDWPTVSSIVEVWLPLAPRDPLVLEARRRAWAAVGVRGPRSPVVQAAIQNGPPPLNSLPLGSRPPLSPVHHAGPAVSPMAPSSNLRSEQEGTGAPPAPRFLLWVDGVGGYLVCEGAETVLGQPVPGVRVDVAIQGDLSRQHATLKRSGEGYLLTAHRPVRVAGRNVEHSAPVGAGEVIELGSTVRIALRRPHPLSATARLDFVSRHRTQPPVDAVLLMAETLILGPATSSHVHCPHWSREVVLYRQGPDLVCRYRGRFEVDGTPAEGSSVISRASQIVGPDFTMSLEKLG